MQLHVCLLLVLTTTVKTLALSQHLCGEDVHFDRKPAGQINLTLPGHFTNYTDGSDILTHHSSENTPVSNCTWTLNIPLGRTVLLKLVWLESNSSITIRCVWNKEDLVLEGGEGTALLSGCGKNKATLSWKGATQSSNAIELAYYVQEDDTHSFEDHTNPHSNHDLLRRSQTGTSFTRTAPIRQELRRGTEGLESSFGPYSSSQEQGLLHPTSPVQGLAGAGSADRETLPLPEEEPNNGADKSGTAHLADSPTSARERTHPYFHSTVSLFHTLNTEKTETNSRKKLPETQTTLTNNKESKFTILLSDIHQFTETAPSVSSFISPQFTTSPPRQDAVSGEPGEKKPTSWRSHRSTGGIYSDQTNAVTSDPLKSPTEPPEEYSTSANPDTEPTASSLSKGSQGPHMADSPTTPITGINKTVSTLEAASFHPNRSRNGSLVSASSDIQTDAFESSVRLDNIDILQTYTSSSTQNQTNSHVTQTPDTNSPFTQTPYTNSPFAQTSQDDTQAATENTQRNFKAFSSSPDVTEVDDGTFGFTDSLPTPRAAQTFVDVDQSSSSNVNTETYTLHPTLIVLHDISSENSQTSAPLLSTSQSIHLSTNSKTIQTYSAFPGFSSSTDTTLPLPSTTTQSAAHTPLFDQNPIPTDLKLSTIKSTSSHTPLTKSYLPLPSSTDAQATHKQSQNYLTTTYNHLLSPTTIKPVDNHEDREVEVEKLDEIWQGFPSSTNTQTPTAGSQRQPAPYTALNPNMEKPASFTPSVFKSKPTLSSTTSHAPKFYIVPDQPAAIGVESIELLLQIIVENPRSTLNPGLVDDTAASIEPYLHRAPGFNRLLDVWSSGHAVQSLVQFKTSGALQWLGVTGPMSLLERTGLANAVREGRKFRSSKINNITLGGVQADVCDWLLTCPSGFKCVSQPGSSNYSCSSFCHFDHCHHHGICTHHPSQLPICRCLVGEDFWYMGQRCDVRMTRVRLVGACLAILLIMVTVIGILAFVAVRRYKAALIQAKVDQTRSSYRRFNHFDELSGRFWLRSMAGSADSLDNPAFTRSDELLHLRALDRPCCYHDDTLSLASTCPSLGTRINTIYPHSSQYGWRGSEVSMGDGVLDSGKASDLSVCSWPVEPIQWTPFPLLQQLASNRTPMVRVSRTRSYCEGMELVDMGKSWTA
ncbi:mucin-3B [Labrus bergylta]|uniref:mucin-3B n=1 Tax=Labrus bergylta TaxID=56723 RepID=UPI0033136977